MNKNVLLMPHLCLYLQKDSQQDDGHSSDLDQKRSDILLTTKDHEENGTESLNWWWSNSEKAETQFSEQRIRCLEERSRAKEVENYQSTSVPMEKRLKLFFAQLFLLISSVSTQQSPLCVMNTVLVKHERRDPCRHNNLTHCSSQQDCWGQHLHLRLKFLHKKIYCKRYKDRVERPSQRNLLINICTDAGILTVVEVWQWFMTKDTEKFSQFTDSVAWREYILPRDENLSEPKGWIRGNTEIGPVLEVTTCCQQGKYGVEIRI